MLINIGGLWESPIAIADERPISPAVYSENYESDRPTSGSYNKEFYTTAAGYDITDFIYVKSVSPGESDQDETNLHSNEVNSSGTFHENLLKACYGYMDVKQIPPNKKSDNDFQKEALRDWLSPNSGGGKGDIKVHLDVNAGSDQHLRGHPSKALRVRSSTAKDRHSKVNTAKGVRDRRVRLSVLTAIQLYNLQDKLGFDQPSKALDWLMDKAKSAIDELPKFSSMSKLNCLSSNSATSLIDIVSTSGGAERVSHSVPRIVACPMKKTENKMGSTAAFIEERKQKDLKVAAKNIVRLPMLQHSTEASSNVQKCSERKKRQPSVLQKKGNKREEITLQTPFRQQSGSCDIGFSCPDNKIACLAPLSSSCMPSGQVGMDGQKMPVGSRAPFVVYSSHFELSQHAEETNNLSEKCMSPLVFSLQNSDSIYLETALRLTSMMNGHENRVPQASSSLSDSTYGTNGRGKGFDRLNPQHGIKAFYFEQDQ